jgi:hypothetical protein
MTKQELQTAIELIAKHYNMTTYEVTRLSMIEFNHYYNMAKEKANE